MVAEVADLYFSPAAVNPQLHQKLMPFFDNYLLTVYNNKTIHQLEAAGQLFWGSFFLGPRGGQRSINEAQIDKVTYC